MSKERRRHERFPLILTAIRTDDSNQEVEIKLTELSVGGCFAAWFEEAQPGYIFGMKLPLVDGNSMPLICRVRYRYMTIGIGVEFVGITYQEQEKIGEVIMHHLWREGMPEIDPFAPPVSAETPRTT